MAASSVVTHQQHQQPPHKVSRVQPETLWEGEQVRATGCTCPPARTVCSGSNSICVHGLRPLASSCRCRLLCPWRQLLKMCADLQPGEVCATGIESAANKTLLQTRQASQN